MKTSFVSNLSIQNAMRQTIARAQQEQIKLQEEVATGAHADLGVALGVRTTRFLNLDSDFERLKSLASTNSLTTLRLASSQLALDKMSKAVNDASNAAIMTNSPGPADLVAAKESFEDALSSFTGAINQTVAGEFLFSGINSDVIPMNDYLSDPASAAKSAFDTAFAAFMGPPNNFATTAEITPAAMKTFISDLEASYMGAGWDDWSNASDQNMTSRISNSEFVQSSTNANTVGVRKFALGAVIGYELATLKLSDDTRSVVSNALTTDYLGPAITGIDGERTKLGISEARIKQANTSIDAQKAILEKSIGSLAKVDPFEVGTRLKTLEAQLQLAYTLTSRIQNMSLLNYL